MKKQIIKLTYTKEMIEQDKLWETEDEDTMVMEKLYKDIVKEAKSKGFKGYVDIYQGPGEAIADVFDSYEEYEKSKDECTETDMCGFCKSLIKCLENRLNHKIIEKEKNYVYDGDLVGWTTCEIISEDKRFQDLSKNIVGKAKVKTEDGTILDRFLKIIYNAHELEKDGCVYKYGSISQVYY